MFGQYQGYIYPEKQYELFERQLPYKSIKIPYHKENTRLLRHVQQKHQLEALRLQVLDRCKFQELEYLQMLKKQRQVMEDDIKKRKHQAELKRMEEIIEQNKKINQRKDKKIKDSLDQLKRQEQVKKQKEKQERIHSAYSSSLESLNQVYAKTIRPSSKKSGNLLEHFQQKKDFEEVKIEEAKKEDQIQRIKDEIMNKYRFAGQPMKKPKPIAVVPQEKTVVDWWVNKVKQFREKQKQEVGEEPQPEPSSSQESDSEQRSEPSPPKKDKGKGKGKLNAKGKGKGKK